MLKAKVTNPEVRAEHNETLKKTFYSQTVAIFTGQEYPLLVKVSVPAADKGYPVGDYIVASDSFRVGPYGGLEVDRFGFRLIPAANK